MSELFSKPSTLRKELSPTDESWEFPLNDVTVANPGLIKVVIFETHYRSKRSNISLRFETAPQVRLTRREPTRALVIARFPSFRLMSDRSFQKNSDRMTAEYIEKFLKTGIVLNGDRYNFFGHSSNQLRSRSCFLYAATKHEIATKIQEAANVARIRNASKQAKYIGLLFAEADVVCDLDPARCQDIDDILNYGYNFTDGCGHISERLAKDLACRQRIIHRGKRYTPSVFQIRYRGYKGILSLKLDLDDGVDVQFRRSMKKFEDGKDLAFLLNSYTKPYTFGHLNDEIVVLLEFLGIDKGILLRKQKAHIQMLRQAYEGNTYSTFTVLSFLNQQEVAEKFLLEGFEEVRETVRGFVDSEFERMLTKASKYKCRILVPDSRLLFGIADPSQYGGRSARIPQGCCYVRVTDLNGKAVTLYNVQVLVTRNPCFHPGDLRKLAAINIPGLEHLVDCIVFSTQGDRPVADEMAGGDLDGDKFFVCWDTELIPSTLSQAATYPPPTNHPKLLPITNDDRVEHFARYPGLILGQLKNLYLSWAEIEGPLSAECQQISRLFSHSVDGGKVKIPPELEQCPSKETGNKPSILDSLHKAAQIEMKTQFDAVRTDVYDSNLLEALIHNNLLAISEFELIRMTLRWCRRNNKDFMDYANAFDYNSLDDNEQTWLLTQVPPSRGFPGLVKNALIQSNILLPEQLVSLHLDHPRIHWRCVFDSSTSRMDSFLDATCHALEMFKHKLVVIRPDERLALAIYIPQIAYRGAETLVDDKVRVLAFPYTQELDLSKYTSTPTKQDYRLYCDESKFQLYHRKKASTFVFITQSGQDDTIYKNLKSERSRRKARDKTLKDQSSYACRASIALEKINQRVSKHIGAINRNGITQAEIYAISNRDVRSMDLLDLWLNYVDTGFVHPLFKYKISAPGVSGATDHVLSPVLTSLHQVYQDETLESVERLSSLREIDELLDILSKRREISRLRSIFTRLLDHKAGPSNGFDRTSMSRLLLHKLQSAPYMTSSFFRSEIWYYEHEHLTQDLNDVGSSILKSLLTATDATGEFVVKELAVLLEEVQTLRMTDLLGVIEAAALSISNVEFAVHLLVEMLYQKGLALIRGEASIVQRIMKGAVGIALDHIDEASHAVSFEETLQLHRDCQTGGNAYVKAKLRIDLLLAETLKVGHHVYFLPSLPAGSAMSNILLKIDAVVVRLEGNNARFRCTQKLPMDLSESPWKVFLCGSFNQAESMYAALKSIGDSTKPAASRLRQVLGTTREGDTCNIQWKNCPKSITDIVTSNKVTLIQTPPGTLKTDLIVSMITTVLAASIDSRVLVAAPENYDVDKILKCYVQWSSSRPEMIPPLRITATIENIDHSLLEYVFDTASGIEQPVHSRLVFVTCTEASSTMLVDQEFDLVVVDNACQQQEPVTIIPMLKSCCSTVLLGDHVAGAPRVRVQNQTTEYHISLFQRLWQTSNTVSKIVLDLQSRMHPETAAVISSLFYGGKLQTDKSMSMTLLKASKFPWPRHGRVIFVQCSRPEDLGDSSKSNSGQTQLCSRIYNSLLQQGARNPVLTQCETNAYSSKDVAIFTPYLKQVEALKAPMANAHISLMSDCSKADVEIAILVTTRSNSHCHLGLLSNQKHLNNALSCARSGVIIVGDRHTLGGPPGQEASGHEMWQNLLRLCKIVYLPSQWYS